MSRIALVTLVVDDYDEAIRFYTEAVGFRLVEDEARPDGSRWVVVRPGGHQEGTGLLLARAKDDAQRSRIGDQTGGRVGFFLHTEDFAGDHARMSAAACDLPGGAPPRVVRLRRRLPGPLRKPLGPAPARRLTGPAPAPPPSPSSPRKDPP